MSDTYNTKSYFYELLRKISKGQGAKMGLAASQAQLLTITSRMSDNELRAQLVGNAKMRLAGESSQVSENYINALNDAQMMFTNYDANNMQSYQKLSFNAMTSYNQYNNQYGLSNLAGQLLVSEADATYFEKSNNSLEKFLEFHGLSYETSYFNDENLGQHLIYDADKGGYGVKYLIRDDQGALTAASLGYTPDELKTMYLGISHNEGKIGSNSYTHIGYQASLESLNFNQYVGLVEEVETTENAYFAALKPAMKSYTNSLSHGGYSIEKMMKDATSSDGMGDNHFKNMLNNFTNIINTLVSTTVNSGGNILNLVNKDNGNSNIYYSNLLNSISDFKDTMSPLATEWVNTSKNSIIVGKDELGDFGEYLKINYNSFGGSYTANIMNGDDDTAFTPAQLSSQTVEYTDQDGNVTGTTKYKIELEGPIDVPDPAGSAAFNVKYTVIESTLDGVEPNDVVSVNQYIYEKWNPNTAGEEPPSSYLNDPNYTLSEDDYRAFLANALNSFVTNSNSNYNLEAFYEGIQNGTIPSSNKDKITEARENYKQAVLELQAFFENKLSYDENGKAVFGSGFVGMDPSGYQNITDIDWFKKWAQDNGRNIDNENFNVVNDIITLERMMNTYGEPQMAWVDVTNVNENGNKKAEWYTNLFQRMQLGYAALEDGLAASTEWIKYALESGLVKMEQVGVDQVWTSFIYTNCSDITEQTNNLAITLAEAEYTRAMNKIETKDKRYDQELKNIDTEHTSLQTEYDSIKAAMDKNIERNFKMYSA